MVKRYMAITYPPKIEPANDGRCTQTIRRGDKINVGDCIEFHNWAGKPYRSKWINRFDVTVIEAIPISVDSELGIGARYLPNSNLIKWNPWDSEYVDNLARLDYIDPPTGKVLREVLFKLNEPQKMFQSELYQIIRW